MKIEKDFRALIFAVSFLFLLFLVAFNPFDNSLLLKLKPVIFSFGFLLLGIHLHQFTVFIDDF